MTRSLIVSYSPAATGWAQHFFSVLKTTRDPVIGVRWFDVPGNRRALTDILKALAVNDVHQMMATIAEAEAGWDLAHEALKELAVELSETGARVPISLEAYRNKVMMGYEPKISSTQKGNRWLRNIAIAYAVDVLFSRFDVKPTGKGSGSALVAKSLRGNGGTPITARQVANIWREYDPWLRRMTKFVAHLQAFTE